MFASTTSARARRRVEDLARVRVAEIERERVLAAIADQEVAALAAADRAMCRLGFAFERLHLDDVRAPVGEDLAGPRHRDEVPELEHGHAREGPLVAHAAQALHERVEVRRRDRAVEVAERALVLRLARGVDEPVIAAR
jgi:hypothetical protein